MLPGWAGVECAMTMHSRVHWKHPRCTGISRGNKYWSGQTTWPWYHSSTTRGVYAPVACHSSLTIYSYGVTHHAADGLSQQLMLLTIAVPDINTLAHRWPQGLCKYAFPHTAQADALSPQTMIDMWEAWPDHLVHERCQEVNPPPVNLQVLPLEADPVLHPWVLAHYVCCMLVWPTSVLG